MCMHLLTKKQQISSTLPQQKNLPSSSTLSPFLVDVVPPFFEHTPGMFLAPSLTMNEGQASWLVDGACYERNTQVKKHCNFFTRKSLVLILLLHLWSELAILFHGACNRGCTGNLASTWQDYDKRDKKSLCPPLNFH